LNPTAAINHIKRTLLHRKS